MKRREFLGGLAVSTAALAAPARSVAIQTPEDATCRRAAKELEDALRAHDVALNEEGALRITAAITDLPAESFTITPGIHIVGGSPRAVAYGLLELADRVRLSDQPFAALDIRASVTEAPANRIRSVMKCFTSDVEDKSWYNDRDAWRRYLAMLATQRFNRFHLAFGVGYDFTREIRDCYFHFAYPFLLDVPGYHVRARGLDDRERDSNLEMLRFISSEAAALGLHFQLGLWTHAYAWTESPSANYIIDGLTADTHAPYCRDALYRLLTECPGISGVTFRVHGESGVPEGDYGFWKTVYQGMVKTGRKLEIDMHAKGMDERMIETALSTGLPVTISPKYIAEHMGLPYHQAGIRELEMPPAGKQDSGFFAKSNGSRKFLRYGYGDLLTDDRRYAILHRIWPGTQRLLLWGDPELARGFSRQASFCATDGLEIFEPLSFKGRKGSGLPGGRCAYADAALEPEGGDWNKYLYTYRVWGRALYNPESDPDGTRRYLRHAFQRAATPVEAALAHASRILPLITTAHGPSAANNSYWPELSTNMPIIEGSSKEPYSDTPVPKRFGTVSPFDPELFSTIEECADELIAGRRSHKYSPLDIAARLEDLARAAIVNLQKAGPQQSSPEFRRLSADVSLQAFTGRFFAAKFRAGVFYAAYMRTGDPVALNQAFRSYRIARLAWTEAATLASRVYRPDITFGWDPVARGHWSDRIAAIDADISAMEKQRGSSRDVTARLTNFPPRPEVICSHTPPVSFEHSKALPLALAVERTHRVTVTLHYRHVNQAERFRTAPMTLRDERFSASIPAEYTAAPFPLMYYFDVSGTLYPGLDATLANQPYFVVMSGGATSAAA